MSKETYERDIYKRDLKEMYQKDVERDLQKRYLQKRPTKRYSQVSVGLFACIEVSCDLFVRLAMGWLRLVGSFKLLISFAEYRLFYRALLQKRPEFLRSLLIGATPQQEGT